MAILPAFGQKKIKLESERDSAAYALGQNIANDLMKSKLDTLLPTDYIVAGISHSFSEKNKPLLSNEDALVILQRFFEKVNETQKANEQVENEQNLAKGTAFLEKNKQDTSVKVTPSGLQYKIIEQGTGAIPTQENTVKVHYKGTLIDGTVFDSSYSRGEPAEFGVTQVIKGWTQALTMMPTGSKWQVFIPYNLAYGERGAGNDIKPFSTLIFDIELIDIVK